MYHRQLVLLLSQSLQERVNRAEMSGGTDVIPCSVCASSKGGFVCRGVVNCRPMKIKAMIMPAHFNFVRISNIPLERFLFRIQRAPGI